MNPTEKKKFIIIDGNSLLHRAWHALPPLSTKKGEIVNAVYGFAMILMKAIREIQPSYIAVAFDKKGPTFRHKEFRAYKAKRVAQPEELYAQIRRVKQLLGAFKIPFYEKTGFEADDVIGTISCDPKVRSPKIDTMIITGDLDTLQLVDKNTRVYTLRKGITDIVVYDIKKIIERYGLGPEQLVNFKALRGDPSDNIPGVKGIGEKGALELVKKFGSLEDIYRHLEACQKSNVECLIKEKTRSLLLKYKDDAYLSRRLVTIVQDLPLKFELEASRWRGADKEKVASFFQELEFSSLLGRIGEIPGRKERPRRAREEIQCLAIATEKSFNKFLAKLSRSRGFGLSTDDGAVGFCWKPGEAYYIPISNFKFQISNLKSVLEDENIKKYGHDLKHDIKFLANYGIDLKGISFDTQIASYLLNPGGKHDLQYLIFDEFGERRPEEFDKVSALCWDLHYIWKLVRLFKERLEKENLLELFYEIEMPLVKVLAQMEEAGIKIERCRLETLSRETDLKLKKIKKEIMNLAGEVFNINSPRELRRILFEKLKISPLGIKRTKTGLSTAASELEKLQKKHPIIDLIFSHRELFKLKTTYLEGLCELADGEGRIHTNFNQTVTATGRLSSSDPNLQNIPVRGELGQEIRKAFVAEKGARFLVADYSQIDLRIIASISGDKKMIESFKRGEDIHARTASELNKVSLEAVTPEMRRGAKTVNFGIIYGISPYGLAQATGMNQEEAESYLDEYFKLHPAIKEYMKQTLDRTRKKGYIETLFGRKRWLAEINSSVPQVRSSAERAAINFPIQGTSADIIKIAMVAIAKILAKYQAKMLVQVHDELLFEVPEANVESLASVIRKIMEAPSIKLTLSPLAKGEGLKVPLKVDLSVGNNWGELERL